MKYIAAIIFYTLTSSVFFVYGIGLERFYIHSMSEKKVWHFYAVNFVLIFFTASFLRFVSGYILLPLGMYFLLPLVFFCATAGAEKAVFILYKKIFPLSNFTAINEKIFTYGIILLSVYTASCYAELLLIILSAFVSLFVFTAVLSAIRVKIGERKKNIGGKLVPVILTSMGFLGFILYFVEISWLLPLFL